MSVVRASTDLTSNLCSSIAVHTITLSLSCVCINLDMDIIEEMLFDVFFAAAITVDPVMD